MSMGYGFWMNSKGKYFPTNEHGTDIIKNPKRFGLDKGEVQTILAKSPYNPISTKEEGSRGILLKKAFENGWIRIRGSGQSGFSFQFSGNLKSVVENILDDFGMEYFGAMTHLKLDDFSTGRTWSGNFTNLKTAYANDEFSDFQTTSVDSPFRTDDDVRKDIRQRITPQGAIFGEGVKKMIIKILYN